MKFHNPERWDELTLIDVTESNQYEYPDQSIQSFMCPTQWIKNNFTPLRDYKLPNINTLAEIAKIRMGL